LKKLTLFNQWFKLRLITNIEKIDLFNQWFKLKPQKGKKLFGYQTLRVEETLTKVAALLCGAAPKPQNQFPPPFPLSTLSSCFLFVGLEALLCEAPPMIAASFSLSFNACAFLCFDSVHHL
jgi:hypothetical protein